MTDSNGINEEYEKIFGVTQRPTLFSNDDIEYNALRQEIINSPTLKISKKNLPFEGIKLVPYEDYCAENTVKSLGGKLAKLFRIKQVENGIVVCNAAGFYNKQVGFVVIQGSYCRQSDFFSQLATNMSDTKDKISFLDSFKIKNGMLQQCIHRNYSSASLAASIFLGRRASFKEWKDIWGRSLDYYYSEYKDSAIEEKEYKMLLSILTSNSDHAVQTELQLNGMDSSKTMCDNGIHYFFIKRGLNSAYTCDAVGCYDLNTNMFVVKAGSILSHEINEQYEYSTSNIVRRTFLKKMCDKDKIGFRLRKDAVFDSPSAAATMVLGRPSNGWKEWRDSNKQTLDTVYRQ